jgi:hypothetical protein
MPDAAWVVAARAANQGRTAGDASLSGILEQHMAQASQKAAGKKNANAGNVVATNLAARAIDGASDVTTAGGGVARDGRDVGVGVNDGGGDDDDDDVWLVGVNLPTKSKAKGRLVAISLGGPAAETPTTRDGGLVIGAGQDRKSYQKKKKKEKEKKKKYVSIRR